MLWLQIESARKDVEHLFGMIKMRFSVLKDPIVLHDLDDIQNMIHACCILWNMQRRYEEELELGDSEYWKHLEQEGGSEEDDLNAEEVEERINSFKMSSFFERDLLSVSMQAGDTLREGNHVGPIQWGPRPKPTSSQMQQRAELRAKLVVDFEYRMRSNKIERIRTKNHMALNRQADMNEGV